MAGVAITRTDLTAAELRAAAVRTDDPKVARRVLAIAMVLEGHTRATAATACAMDRQTLRDWVHRFNAEGLDGLSDRPRSGRAARRATGRFPQGAENWAAVASLVGTCKLNAVDPQRYFTELLTRLVNGWPQVRIDQLMSWCWTTPAAD